MPTKKMVTKTAAKKQQQKKNRPLERLFLIVICVLLVFLGFLWVSSDVAKNIDESKPALELRWHRIYGVYGDELQHGSADQDVIVLARDQQDMRKNVTYSQGECLYRVWTHYDVCAVGEEYLVSFGDPFTFKGVYLGLHEYREELRMFFDVGSSYVALRLSCAANVNAKIEPLKSALLSQIESKRTEAKDLRASAGQLNADAAILLKRADDIDVEADQLLSQIQ